MKKMTLTVLGLFFSILYAFSQNEADSAYLDRKLKVEEVNLVSSYYHQNGNHSAVTGGLGTELLTDFSNTLDVRFSKWSKNKRKHSFGFEMGFDTYTSASSDMIDPNTITSPSHTDQRYYPSIFWSVNNPEKNTDVGGNLSYSNEYDYKSYGGGLTFTKASKDNNSEIAIRANAFFDKWAMILPEELRYNDYPSGSRSTKSLLPVNDRNSFNVSMAWSQIVNQRLQTALIIEPSYQYGQLATPYQRVYFTDSTARVENLPSNRWKLAIGGRANYFAGDNVILRGFYRYYTDQWKLAAHTLELEAVYKFTPFFSVSPFYRYYTQKGINYFAPIQTHQLSDTFYTSDYDLSTLHSQSFGAGVRFDPPGGILGISSWRTLKIRYAHYLRSDALQSNIITVQLKFK
jgi:Protein of unknown function (DUF3570)